MGDLPPFAALLLVLAAASADAQGACDADVLAVVLGSGAPGPTLWTPHGAPVVGGGPFDLQVRDGTPGAAGVLLFGASARPTFVPEIGATLYPKPPWVVVHFALDAEGVSPSLLALPQIQPAWCGLEAVVQAFVASGATPGGLEATDALRLRCGVAGPLLFPNAEVVIGAQVEVADLNADGRADLVGADGEDVVVRLATGAYTFGAASALETATTWPRFSARDFDNDGDVDVARLKRLPGEVLLLLGAGDGTLQPGTTSPTWPGTDPDVPTAADLDGDGWLDLGIASQVPDELLVLLGGGGAFVPLAPLPVDDLPTRVVFGDWDLDGALDAATSHVSIFSSTKNLYRGHGDGSFTTYAKLPFSQSSQAIAVGDVDADGDADVAIGGVGVALSNGDGTFAAADVEPVGVPGDGAAVLADLDGDLDLDLAVQGLFDLTVLQGDGAGGFTAAQSVSAQGGHLVAADLDSDLDLDLATSPIWGSSGTPAALLHENDGLGGFPSGAFAFVPLNLQSAAAVDVDVDGVIDAASISWAPGEIVVVLGEEPGQFDDEPLFSGAPQFLDGGGAFADLDGNGVPDAVAVGQYPHEAYAFRGLGDGKFGVIATAPLGEKTWSCALADLDQDGVLDLCTSSPAGISTSLGDGQGSFEAATYFAASASFLGLDAGDVDGDGFPDVAACVHDSTQIAVLFGAGDGKLHHPTAIAVPFQCVNVVVAPLDGENGEDLVVGGSGGFLAVLSREDGAFDVGPAHESNPDAITAADFDGDGRTDVAAGVEANRIVVYAGDGAGALDLLSSCGAMFEVEHLMSGDFDGDGNPDLAAAGDRFHLLLSRLGE